MRDENRVFKEMEYPNIMILLITYISSNFREVKYYLSDYAEKMLIFLLTALALILYISDSTFLPPIYGRRNPVNVLIHESTIPTWRASEHSVMINLGASIDAPEFMVGHVSEPVQLQLVRLVHFIGTVDMHHVAFEHVEAVVLLIEASRNRVVAPPSLVQIPQPFLGFQVLFIELKALSNSQNQSKG